MHLDEFIELDVPPVRPSLCLSYFTFIDKKQQQQASSNILVNYTCIMNLL